MQIGQILKEKGMQLALLNSGTWSDQAIEKLREYLQWRKDYCIDTDLFGMDQFRAWGLENGLPEPKSINAFGALPKIACRAGLIEPTGQYTKSMLSSAHRRAIQLWRPI